MSKVSLFSQTTKLLSREKFQEIVNRHQSDKHCKGINSWTHLISMLFCQMGHAESVRDISNGLRSTTGNIRHLGCEHPPSKSSVSYVNKHRTYEIFKEYYYAMFEELAGQTQFQRTALRNLKKKLYILDASVIPLSLSLYNWAHFRSHKGAVKLHMMLDYDGCLPVFADLTHGKVHEINIARDMNFPSRSILVFDMGYYDFKWWNNLDSRKIKFVTRAKDNLDYEVVEKFDISREKDPNVLEDANIILKGSAAQGQYPGILRMVRYWDEKNQKVLVFLTNGTSWTATTVAQIYQKRWNIEAFFKIIKQNLKIKSFVGTSENAVNIQIWTALLTILLLAFLKLKAKFKWNMSNLITFIRLNLFVKIDLWKWIDKPFEDETKCKSAQLNLFSG